MGAHRLPFLFQASVLQLTKAIDQRLVLLRRTNADPQELRNPRLLEVPHDHTLL